MSENDLISTHLPMLYRIAWTLTGNEADAEDLAHDAMVAALRSLKDFRSESKLSTWLVTILVNRHRTRRRSHALRARLKSGVPGASSDVSWEAERSELHEVVRGALRQLEEEDRLLLVLSAYQGLDSKEIGEIVGQPAGTVRFRLHEARQALRRILEGYDDGK